MKQISNIMWQWRRFFQYKLSKVGKNAPPVLIVSMPKAGTNLIERVFVETEHYHRVLRKTLLDDDKSSDEIYEIMGKVKRGQFLTSHIGYDQKYSEIRALKKVLVVRHPLAVASSYINYVLKREDHRQHKLFTEAQNLDERVELLITGHKPTQLRSFNATLDRYINWSAHADVIVQFEDLIGTKGKGTAAKQQAILKQILQCVGLDDLNAKALEIYSKDAPTFNHGQIDSYTSFFSSGQQDSLIRSLEDRIELLGYDSKN